MVWLSGPSLRQDDCTIQQCRKIVCNSFTSVEALLFCQRFAANQILIPLLHAALQVQGNDNRFCLGTVAMFSNAIYAETILYMSLELWVAKANLNPNGSAFNFQGPY